MTQEQEMICIQREHEEYEKLKILYKLKPPKFFLTDKQNLRGVIFFEDSKDCFDCLGFALGEARHRDNSKIYAILPVSSIVKTGYLLADIKGKITDKIVLKAYKNLDKVLAEYVDFFTR